ncbi:MAG: hypothetical protein ABIO65_12015 [Nitrospiria bacterium]
MDRVMLGRLMRVAAGYGLFVLFVFPTPALAALGGFSPSGGRFGVELAGFAVIVGALGAVRAGGGRWVALGITLAIVAIAVGSVSLYRSGQNDRIPVGTQNEEHPAINGAAPEISPQTVFPTRDATIGQAERAAGATDRAND